MYEMCKEMKTTALTDLIGIEAAELLTQHSRQHWNHLHKEHVMEIKTIHTWCFILRLRTFSINPQMKYKWQFNFYGPHVSFNESVSAHELKLLLVPTIVSPTLTYRRNTHTTTVHTHGYGSYIIII